MFTEIEKQLQTCPDLRHCCESLPGGWLISTNLNNLLKRTLVKVASEVSGLKLGHDIIVDI